MLLYIKKILLDGNLILLHQTITSSYFPILNMVQYINWTAQWSNFEININRPVLTVFFYAAHVNELKKHQSTTGLVFTFCGVAVVYKSKTKSLTASSSTEAEFIIVHVAAKIAKYLWMVLKQLRYKQKLPTPIYIENMSALQIINNNTSPTERTRHLDIR